MENTVPPRLMEHLDPGEQIRITAAAREATLAVTDQRVVVATEARLALAVPFENLRRIQFDIEHRRPATLVIVPEAASDEPQVLAIPRQEYEAVATALVHIGHAIAGDVG